MTQLDWNVLELDYEREATRIAARLREIVGRTLHRRGLVVAISGGIDSSTCLGLAVRALGPDKVYALIRSFCANQVRFHAADGGGYAFAAEQIIALDPLNPQVAARLARSFDRWKKFDTGRQAHARPQLERIRASAGLSKDTLEVVTKALA